jgi:hypothetical protein
MNRAPVVKRASAHGAQLVDEAHQRAVLYWIARRESWTLIVVSMLAPPPLSCDFDVTGGCPYSYTPKGDRSQPTGCSVMQAV